MKEQKAFDESFYRQTGIDTSRPNWQIESLSDLGLYGFIVDANQRTAIPNHGMVEKFLADYADAPQFSKPKSFEGMLNTVKGLANSAVNAEENYPDASKYRTIFQETAHKNIAVWLKQNQSLDIALRKATLDSLITATSGFNWSEDQKRLKLFSESVSLIAVAYNELAQREASSNG